MKLLPGAVTGEETTATGEERDTMGTGIGNKVQEKNLEHPPKDQIRSHEVTIPEEKTNTTNVDYIGKRVIWQRAAVIVLLVEVLPTLIESVLGIKGGNKPT